MPLPHAEPHAQPHGRAGGAGGAVSVDEDEQGPCLGGAVPRAHGVHGAHGAPEGVDAVEQSPAAVEGGAARRGQAGDAQRARHGGVLRGRSRHGRHAPAAPAAPARRTAGAGRGGGSCSWKPDADEMSDSVRELDVELRRRWPMRSPAGGGAATAVVVEGPAAVGDGSVLAALPERVRVISGRASESSLASLLRCERDGYLPGYSPGLSTTAPCGCCPRGFQPCTVRTYSDSSPLLLSPQR